MNGPQAPAAGAAHPANARRGDEINLLELLDVVLDHRWLIAAVTVFSLAIGVAYALLATPIYQANTLIQVEDSKGDPMGSMLGQSASGLFDIRSPATAEMQILRSRLVVEQAVSNLGLDIEAEPRYVPLVGRWLSRRAKDLSSPGIFGWGGFVSGTEAIQVSAFDVPQEVEGKRFSLRVTGPGAYRLISPDGDEVGQGRVGQEMRFELDGVPGRLLVREIQGREGAAFRLTRYFRLEVVEDLQKDMRISEEGKQSGVIRASLEGDDPRE
ncbi:MAG: tyrosine protein kinase, partial [Proteobacteria bacterium]|nr:tyrosine protein kinase [Pseudomonadota bacterium]